MLQGGGKMDVVLQKLPRRGCRPDTGYGFAGRFDGSFFHATGRAFDPLKGSQAAVLLLCEAQGKATGTGGI